MGPERGGRAIPGWKYWLETEGREIELPEGEVTIGRSRTCTVALRDPAASRSHAQLILSGGTVRARDLQSSNGTYLNGERLEAERLLGPGDRLTIGETDLVVRVQGPEDASATVRLEAGAIPRSPSFADPGAGSPAGVASPPALGDSTVPAVPTADEVLAPVGEAEPDRRPLSPGGTAGTGADAGQSASSEPAPGSPPPPPPGSPVSPPERWAVGAMGQTPVAPTPASSPVRPPPVAPPPPPSPSAPEGRPAPPTPAPAPPRPAVPPTAGAVERSLPSPDLPPPAGFWIRCVAVMLDGAWMMLFALLASLPFGGPLRTGGAVASVAVLLFFSFAVPVLGWWLRGATPGKAVLGLSVRTLDGAVPITLGRALARWLATWVSGLFFGLGFLMVAFTANRRALHDLAAATYVARRRR